jgi:hypothetical protein
LTVSSTASVLSTAISFAPSRVKISDAARPMPEPAPVMTADLPSRRPIYSSHALVLLVMQRVPMRSLRNALEPHSTLT